MTNHLDAPAALAILAERRVVDRKRDAAVRGSAAYNKFRHRGVELTRMLLALRQA